jgi:hypothetical protein
MHHRMQHGARRLGCLARSSGPTPTHRNLESRTCPSLGPAILAIVHPPILQERKFLRFRSNRRSQLAIPPAVPSREPLCCSNRATHRLNP